MNIIESIEHYEHEILRSTKKVALYQFFNALFDDLEFPKCVQTWATELESNSNPRYWIEFTAGWQDDAEKDFQPFIHAMAQKFNVEFKKSRNYDESALDYNATFSTADNYGIHIKVNSVVPKTCRVEETVENLSDEEIHKSRDLALSNIKTTRIVRKIVCD